MNSIFQVVNEYGWTLLDLVFPNKAMAEVAKIQFCIQYNHEDWEVVVEEIPVAKPTQFIMYDELIKMNALRD